MEIGEGLGWLWRRPLIRFMMLFISLQNLLTAGMPLIVIVVAQRQQASSAMVGIILAFAGVGGIVGALVAPLLQRRFGFARSFLAALWLFVAAWPLIALALAGALVLLVWNGFDMLQFSYRLRLIPDALQVRVNSVYRLGAYGGQSLGLALGGVLVQQLGAGTATWEQRTVCAEVLRHVFDLLISQMNFIRPTYLPGRRIQVWARAPYSDMMDTTKQHNPNVLALVPWGQRALGALMGTDLAQLSWHLEEGHIAFSLI